MTNEIQNDHIIADHPRQSELVEIWQELHLRRPEGLEAKLDFNIIDAQFPLPLFLFDLLSIPAPFIEDRPADELAFGLAYAAALNPFMRWHADVDELTDDVAENFDDDSMLALPIGAVLGIAGGLTAIWRGFTRFAAREQLAIETAVDWVHRAGFDPNAGVKLFMSLSGWFRQHPPDKPAVEPSAAAKLSAIALFAPLLGAVSVPMSKDPPMATAVDRAAAVRTAVVARGWHQ